MGWLTIPVTPLVRSAHQGGGFLPEEHEKTKFDKPALTLGQQLDRLIERDFEVPDRERRSTTCGSSATTA